MKYGYGDDLWEAAKDEMVAILSARAKAQKTIAYSDLVRQVHAIALDPDSFALAAMLGEISEAEDASNRGMLTVIVVHKTGDMKPGPGFFDLAQRLGRDTSDLDKCWIAELTAVFKRWRTAP